VPPAIYTLPPSAPTISSLRFGYDYNTDYVTCGYLPGYTGTYVHGPTIVYGTATTIRLVRLRLTLRRRSPGVWRVLRPVFAHSWAMTSALYWGGIGWFGHPWREGWWRDHPGERWGMSPVGGGPGGFEHSHDIGRISPTQETTAASVTPCVATVVAWGAHARGDHRRRWLEQSLLPRRQRRPQFNRRAFANPTAARAVTSHRDNIFAGRDGNVFRNSGSGWQQHSGGTWTGMTASRCDPTYHAAPSAPRYGGFSSPNAGLDQHSAARFRGSFRSSVSRSPSSGGFRWRRRIPRRRWRARRWRPSLTVSRRTIAHYRHCPPY